MSYDADAPDAQAWQALDATDRRAAVEAAHDGLTDALHPPTLRRSMHVGLHVTVESLWANGEPHVTRTLERITDQGVRRHAAVHMVMDVMMRRMAALADAEGAWSDERWAATLDALDPADWIGRRMQQDLQG